jgi:hypothetical protein
MTFDLKIFLSGALRYLCFASLYAFLAHLSQSDMVSFCDRFSSGVRRSVRLHFRVHSINPIPSEGFSSNLAQMFTSTRGCAEPMLPMCQLKVKVTIEGQISNNQILDSISCPLCNSYFYLKIFFKFGSNVHLNKGMCRTHVAHVSAQGQGHN